MGIALDWFQLDHSWSRLLERLPAWQRKGANMWTDGWSVVELVAPSRDQPRFGFTLREPCAWPAQAERSDESGSRPAGRASDAETPAGIPVRFRAASRKTGTTRRVPSLIMNHISVNVGDTERERAWLESALGPCVVLARDAAWDPVSGRMVRDAHLFRSPWFYVTIRESRSAPCVDHVGWMASDVETVNRMAGVMASLRWKIVYGPAVVDGSFLFHFEGPDGRVHDFFCPLEELRRRGSSHEHA